MLPQFDEQGKAEEPLCSAKILEKRRQFGRLPSVSAPKTVVFCNHSPLIKEFLQSQAHRSCGGCFSKLYLLQEHPSVAVGDFGKGGAAIASKIEELIAWGTEQFIWISKAGTLHTRAQVGDIVVCDRAVRDEQTSHHYLPPAKYIHAPRRMTNRLQYELKKANLNYHIGSSWTTDRLSPQPSDELVHYQQEGVVTIDTEAATLFAVAHFYQVDLGTLFAVTQEDFLWKEESSHDQVKQTLDQLLHIALEASQDKTHG